MKENINIALVLALIELQQLFEVQIDASRSTMGLVFMQ
jgi:hypothetical protein